MASDSEEIEYQSFDNRQNDNLQNRPLLATSPPRQNDEEGSDHSFNEEHAFMVSMSPDANKSQWNHVDDLDKFFVSVYDYHQRKGFQNMILSESLQLLQFVFVIVFMTYLGWCVNYPELFGDIPHNTSHKTFDDVTYPIGTCIARFDGWTGFILFLCFVFLIGCSIKMLINFNNYLRTRNFFISALNIETRDLSNMTWHEVQSRLLEVQKEEQICIHKQELTHLDIYHRILRFKNYLVAMVNKDLLPLKENVPFIGEHAILTHGMRFNMDCLLYWSPWSIFLNSYTMREEYKNHHRRRQLADKLATHISILALLNLVLCPFIFIYQIIYFFFRYTEFVKRSPSFLGSRQWANYGRLYLRHFNELDHELYARLNRAYIPAKMYMNSFQSTSMIILAKYMAFFAGAPAAVLFILGIMDFNDVMKVEHLFTVASVCGMVATVCSNLIPDENEVYCPERLMMSILAQIHYMPAQWRGKAHTTDVRDEFSMLFQYKLAYILEELFSPIIAPIWLFFRLRPRALQIVDFFRHFTVEVSGVGDVCSFAQMDIKKHGNPQWTNQKPAEPTKSRQQQAENGKTELSLMHFTSTNPEWSPPQESNMFIADIKEEAHRDLPHLTSMVADPISLPSMQYINPVLPATGFGSSYQQSFLSQRLPSENAQSQNPKLRGGLTKLDGPISPNSMMQSTLTSSDSFHTGLYGMNVADESQRELLCGNMSLSVLHLHEAHHRQRKAHSIFRQSSGEDTPPTPRHFPPGASASATVSERYNKHQHISRPKTNFSFQQTPDPSLGISPAALDDRTFSNAGKKPSPPSQELSEMTGLHDQRLPESYTAESGLHYSTDFADEDSVEFSQPYSRIFYHEDDSEPTSMLPLPLPPPVSSAARVTSDPMPKIKEDSFGEHELDTSKE